MQPRQILIVAAVVIVAFGAAFGIAGAGGGEKGKAQAAAGSKAPEVIEVPAAKVTASVSNAAALPALNVPKKKKKPADTGSGTTTPPADNGGTTTPTPPSTNTTPTPPSTNTTPTAPPTNNEPEEPIKVGGGED